MGHYHKGWSKGWKKSARGPAGEWFDSYWEVQYMNELDRDPLVLRWTRHHGLSIPYRKWWGGQGYYEPDFLVEIAGGEKELREVKGEHLFKDANTARKLKAGDAFCQSRGMIFRVITKSWVNPELWTPDNHVIIEAPLPIPNKTRPEVEMIPKPSVRFVLAIGLVVFIFFIIFILARLLLRF